MNAVKANLFLSTIVAIIGIGTPIGLSFVLQGLAGLSSLQAFAAGAALCSTSLGTTFTILGTSGLTTSRLGVVLTSAAMMDDVVGLVMVQIISNLGDSSSFDATIVVRPIGVSIAFMFVLPLTCIWVVKPLAIYLSASHWNNLAASTTIHSRQALLIVHTLVLIALVTGSSYAGTSNLLAAYIAGAAITWWDGIWAMQRKHGRQDAATATAGQGEPDGDVSSIESCHNAVVQGQSDSLAGLAPDEIAQSNLQDNADNCSNVVAKAKHSSAVVEPDERTAGDTKYSRKSRQLQVEELSGRVIYEQYYRPAVSTILKPCFFASIGFSIPITRMFSGSVVWRGFVYASLMTLGKMLCGLCLVRLVFPVPSLRPLVKKLPTNIRACWPLERVECTSRTPVRSPSNDQNRPQTSISLDRTGQPVSERQVKNPSKLPKPRSLYPAAILGSAMVARGEIGFLISSVAESNAIFTDEPGNRGSDAFLIVIWAILICTILGPLAVGLLVKRVKRLQATERSQRSGRDDPLGNWGVIDAT